MKVSLFLSVTGMSANADYIGRQTALACASNNLAANVVPFYSSLEVKSEDYYHIEAGCRIDLLSVPENRLDDILYLWKRLSDVLNPGCLHIELPQGIYSGCICEWPYYRNHYNLIHKSPVKCADDAWHAKPRYGKPLS